MSYISRKGSGLMGFGDTSPTCRTGAAFFKEGNWWVPIRDGSGKEYPLMQTSQILALPMCTAASSSGGGWFDSLVSGATEVLKARATPAPVTNISTVASPGLSTTTKVAIAGAGVLGVVLLMRARK